MEQQEEDELDQVSSWLQERGLSPSTPLKGQLCFLWHTLQHRESQLVTVSRDLDSQHSQHVVEMTEVRRSLEQIRTFTAEKDALAQEIQDENDQLRLQLHRLMFLQDAQMSEVAEMLYQQGLAEIIHCSPSEQVAYLLVERASLLDRRDSDRPKAHGDSPSVKQLEAEAKALKEHVGQSPHKVAPQRGQSPWKRLFGLHKAAQSKTTFIPAEAVQRSGVSLDQECARLERDLEEGSRRLAMAHKEIRRLTDELESARLTQRAYEPELQGAEQEVEKLRQEVEKLKKHDMVELRKAKELNDRLDQEIRALRTRVRALDAEKRSCQETVVSLQKELSGMEGVLHEQQQGHQQQLLTVQTQADQANELAESQRAELTQSNQTCRDLKEELVAQTKCLAEMEKAKEKQANQQLLLPIQTQSQDDQANQSAEVAALQKEVSRMEAALQEQRLQANQLLLTVQAQADQDNQLLTLQAAELSRTKQAFRDLQERFNHQAECLVSRETEVQRLQQQLHNSNGDVHHLPTARTNENDFHDQISLWKQRETDLQQEVNSKLEASTVSQAKDPQTLHDKVCTDNQEAETRLLATQDECESLKEEICEALRCLDSERTKYHEMNEKLKAKLHRAKQKLDDETRRRDDKIKDLERKVSLYVHSLATEKELIANITAASDKLLFDKRDLLKRLSEEEDIKKDSILAASLSKRRVDFLEKENKMLENKTLQLSNRLAALERSLRNNQLLPTAEEASKSVSLTSSPLQSSSGKMLGYSDMRGLLDIIQSSKMKQAEATSSPLSSLTMPLSWSAEMGYLNLTSPQGHSDQLAPSDSLSSTDSNEV